MLSREAFSFKHGVGNLAFDLGFDSRDKRLSIGLLNMIASQGGQGQPVTIKKLRINADLTQVAATRLIDRLEADGMLEIYTNGNETSIDQLDVELTQKGWILVQSLSEL